MKRLSTSAIAVTLAAAGALAGAGAANAQTNCSTLQIMTFDGPRCMSVLPNDNVQTTGSGYGSYGTESLAELSNQILHLGSMIVSLELPGLTDSLGITSPLSTAHSLGDSAAASLGDSIGGADGAS